ncbi:MAG: PTS sugar transporter subunit IIA [Pseudomonadota bacterium]|nr:PTS sugar transporter subunit IIA [Pseudomonadota bacterium]
MPLQSLLAPARIATLAGPLDRDQVLDAAARLMAGDMPALEASIAASLHQRERMGSTAIGHGVAIPHGRCGTTRVARAAFLRLEHPVAFDAADSQPVDLVFALAVPEHFTQQHLQLLSELAGYFALAANREALRAAPGPDALRALLLRDEAA